MSKVNQLYNVLRDLIEKSEHDYAKNTLNTALEKSGKNINAFTNDRGQNLV